MKRFVLILSILVIHTALFAQEKYLLFGKGGGFAGTTTVYKLYPNGRVEKGAGIGEINYTQVSGINKSAAKKLFRRVEHIASQSFSNPGNLYYFICYADKEFEIKYTWGSSDFKTPEDLEALFNDALKLLSKLNYSNKTQQ